VAARMMECGFEFFRGHGCLSLVNVVCFHVEVSTMGRSFVQGSLTECVFMSLSVIRCSSNPQLLQYLFFSSATTCLLWTSWSSLLDMGGK
jgi:hypothetical protein